jgi:hypothetical protein
MLGVLAGDTASVLVVDADELTLRVRDVISGGERLIIRLGL